MWGKYWMCLKRPPPGSFAAWRRQPASPCFPAIRTKSLRRPPRSAEQTLAPTRLTLGSDAYALVHEALSGRLAALEAQKELAHSTDAHA
jgi:hypothetical protein